MPESRPNDETVAETENFLADILEDLNAPEVDIHEQTAPFEGSPEAEALKAALAQKEAEILRLSTAQQEMVIAHAVKDAIQSAGGNYTLLEPHVSRDLTLQEVEGVQTVVVKGPDGATVMTLADRMAEVQRLPEMAAAFLPSVGGGSGLNRRGYVSHLAPIKAYDQATLNAHIEEIATGRVRVTL